jgi:nucleoside-diphosphate-sugar epimerase
VSRLRGESERSRHADFVAGASGAIGSRLVPQLVARGHEVVGTTRSKEKTKRLYELGAEPVVVDVLRETLAAIRHLEQTTVDAGGTVLRYGGIHGPPDDTQLEAVRKRRFPIIGDGAGITSFVHLDDAAAATVLAVEAGKPGIYNVVDDEPAAMREWLPALAAAIGAKPPRRVPRWLARRLAGEAVVVTMTEGRSASNAKAKRELHWSLRYPTWRQGFADLSRSTNGLR